MCDAYILYANMATSGNLTGYGPRRTLVFDWDESEYKLCEVVSGLLAPQKLYNVMTPANGVEEASTPVKKANAFAELVQCLDNKSLS